MPRIAKRAILFVVLVAAAASAWRVAHGPDGRVAALTPVPGATGFEPGERPRGPVLRSRDAARVDVGFGYEIGAACCDYTLALAFAPGADDGTATIVAQRDGRTTTENLAVVRRWDEPRKSYAVAVSLPSAGRADAPALCIKAVVGPRLDRLDLADGTLCAAQRDLAGACRPETLACGLLRPH